MRHRKKGKKLHRKRDERLALKRILAVNLIKRKRIYTTKAKAKELQRFIERLITLAKKGDLAHYRLVISRLGNKEAAKELYQKIAPKYKERKGGYTRIIKTSKATKKDGSFLSLIEFV